MPYYDYRCPERGPFDQRRPLTESGRPAPCPHCGKDAPRMPSAPHVAGGGGGSSSGSREPGGGGCGSGHCGHMH